MSMIIHHVVPGSEEWLALRAHKDTASEASAMMGASKKTSRSELLRMKATRTEKEFSAWVQKNLLDNGHKIEALALPLAEKLVGDDFYPVTVTNTDYEGLLASLDGMTEAATLNWECKSWNEDKASDVRSGKVPNEDLWQVVQQMMLTGAERTLYTLSDGTEERTIHVYIDRCKKREKELLKGWAQFNKDLAGYTVEEAKPLTVAAPVERLPAIIYQMNGLALTSNLDVFKAAAEQAVIDSKLPLVTDQDFADREALCKAFSEAEAKIKLLQEQVLGEVQDIDKFTRELAEIGQLIRQARLAGEKQVKDRKDTIRLEIRQKGEEAIAEHIAKLNDSLGGKVILPRIIDNFTGVMKGKRTLATLQDAVDTELARLKIEAETICESMAANLATLREKSKGVEFLFRDAQDLVQKDSETMALIIDSRISEHNAAEQARIEAETARIRAEEQAKAEAKAAAEAERIRKEEQAEADRIQAEAAAKQKAEDDAAKPPKQEEFKKPAQFLPVAAPCEEVKPVQATEAVVTADFAEGRDTTGRTMIVSKVEYDQLRADQDMLHALREAGVDNWDGYSEALELLASWNA